MHILDNTHIDFISPDLIMKFRLLKLSISCDTIVLNTSKIFFVCSTKEMTRTLAKKAISSNYGTKGNKIQIMVKS